MPVRRRDVWHEAQNQLFAIEGSIELLEASSGAEAQEHRERIRRACSRLDGLLRELRQAPPESAAEVVPHDNGDLSPTGEPLSSPPASPSLPF
jgi:hypothetical protein